MRGHAPEMIKTHAFVKKDPTTPQHFIIWAVYTTYAQHQRPPQPYFTSFHGTHSTSGKSRPSDCERIDGAQDRWPAPSGRQGPLPPLRLSAPNWWVVYVWKIDEGLMVTLPHTASCGWMDAGLFTCRRLLRVPNHMCASACTVAWGGGRPRLRCTGV